MIVVFAMIMVPANAFRLDVLVPSSLLLLLLLPGVLLFAEVFGQHDGAGMLSVCNANETKS